jgi:hypothetical protein
VWRRRRRGAKAGAPSPVHCQTVQVRLTLEQTPEVHRHRSCKAGVLPRSVGPSPATRRDLSLASAAPWGPSGCPFARALPAAVVAGAALALTRRASGPLL